MNLSTIWLIHHIFFSFGWSIMKMKKSKSKKAEVEEKNFDDSTPRVKKSKSSKILKTPIIKLPRLEFHLKKSNFNSRYDFRHTKNRQSSFIVFPFKPNLKLKTIIKVRINSCKVKVEKLQLWKWRSTSIDNHCRKLRQSRKKHTIFWWIGRFLK